MDPFRQTKVVFPQAMPEYLSPEEADDAYKEAIVKFPNLNRDLFLGKYLDNEPFWVGIQPFLLTRGYRLRPRYQPGWRPPWLERGKVTPWISNFEDSITLGVGQYLLDAVRVSDGKKVVLKSVNTSTEEIPISLYLSMSEFRSNPKNHAIPIFDVLLLPDNDERALIAMPQLMNFDWPPFRRLGEITDAFKQLTEGLEFMHEHNIAHRDACLLNLMIDHTKTIPNGVHFKRLLSEDGIKMGHKWKDRHKVWPVKYYIIDFGISLRHADEMECTGKYGQDRSVPEQQLPGPFDPFLVDIYQLGNVMKEIINQYDGTSPMLKVATAMTQQNPEERISLREAYEELQRVSRWHSWRFVWKKETSWPWRILMFFGVQVPQ